MERVMNLNYASSLTDMCELNSSFDRGTLRIAYPGLNRNNSSISKDVFERCIQTMYNCPIVCNYSRESDSLGGHDMELVREADGSLRLINSTQPVGCIPESARYWWDEVEEEDGTRHEYLFADALLWKRQEAYRKIREDGIVSQSMEITVKDGHRDGDVFYVDDFEFTAFTLIGVEPCFESAGLSVYANTDFKAQMSEMMKELKEFYGLVNHSQEVNDMQNSHIMREGGEKVLQEELDLVAEFSKDNDENTDPAEEMKQDFQKEEAAAEEVPAEESAAEAEDVFALESNVMNELFKAVEECETIHEEWGDYPRYIYADKDAEAGMVYVWDMADWNLYGFRYEMNGDFVKIDMESKKRMKYAIVEFDEGEQESPFAATYAAMVEKLNENAGKDAMLREASDSIHFMEAELEELRLFKAEAENAALEEEREKVFARFEDLVGIEAFEDLRTRREEFSDLEALEEKCYAIRGRFGTTAKFSLEEKTPKMKVVKDDVSNEPYGGIFARYGIEAE